MWNRNSTLKTLILVGLACLINACSNPTLITANQPTVIGIVTESSGYPEVTRHNRTYMLAAQSRIYVDDVLVTDKNSKISLTMQDGTTFLLGPTTHFVFHRYDVSGDLSADMTMSSGSLKTNMAPESPRTLEIRTPMAIINAVGAAFWGGFAFAENTLDIALIRGPNMTVSNDHGRIELSQDAWGTSVIGDSAPQPAKVWSNQKMTRALTETKL